MHREGVVCAFCKLEMYFISSLHGVLCVPRAEIQSSETDHLGNVAVTMNNELPCGF